jgi:hypothetical protein
MADPSAVPMQVGVPLHDPGSIYFYLSLAVAALMVCLFASKKFEEPSVEKSEDDFLCQLLPRYLATPQEYTKGLIFYVGTLVLTVVVFSLLGPNVFSLGGQNIPALNYGIMPIFIASVLVGVLPNVPILQEIERRLRRIAHELAYIPAAARAMAEKMASAEFDFGRYNTPGILATAEMEGVNAADFDRPRGTLEYSWARLSCLVYQLKCYRMSGDFENLDGELLQRYAADLDSIEDKRKSLKDEISRYRAEKLGHAGYTSYPLQRTINSTLRQLYVLLGCAVRLKARPHTDVNLALRPFGFMLASVPRPPENNDVMLVAIALMATLVFFVAFVATYLGRRGLWAASNAFPQTVLDPFILAVSAALTHGIAILVSDRVRTRRIGKEIWFTSVGLAQRALPANYIRAAIWCMIFGYPTIILFGLVFAPPSIDQLKGAALYALLPATTGWFYAYHIDNVELGTRPPRLWEIGPQAIVTGFFGFVAASGSIPDDSFDVVYLITALSMIAGASLAWYIPSAAAAGRYNPLADARSERIQALTAAARRRFEDPEAAERWLNQPHPALNNRSPQAAAADAEAYEHVLSLLQGQHLSLVSSNPAEQPKAS